MIIKLFDNDIISEIFLLIISSIIHFFTEKNFCKCHFLQSQKKIKKIEKMRQLTIQLFIETISHSNIVICFDPECHLLQQMSSQ